MTKIDEIAKMCNVSKTTVSRVLNHHPYVSEEKRNQVLKVIKELDYTPSSLARQLRANKSQTMAISVPAIDHPFFSQLIKGVSSKALEKDYKVLIFQTFYNVATEMEMLDLLKNKEVDGIILGALENEWSSIKPFLKYGPILLCNEYHDSAAVPIIGYDEFDAAYKAVSHLIERGHKKIGFCCDTPSSQAQQLRKEGFIKALLENDLQCEEDWMFDHAFSIQDGFRVFTEMSSLADKPTAMFTGNDQVAAGIIKKAMVAGCRVPDDLAVIGYDNQFICQVTTPTITTIDTPIAELGQQAAAKLIKNLGKNAEMKREVVRLPTKLIVREST
ncbi:LacI family DNA-binding transcriptional regulator [Mesobacillus zeae]|uniref:LacI family transcriptional regulator n=1 Tax=Mesobacillus zeae TaxID=1917180 RepID=A0A398AV23_9BACI|nr:LacI family DNA-binding transcriptional regulator [Mesobacillus zeae]RID81579.1 LacI family transcriptional regulator [Mesobacillus zeae]